MKALIEEIKSTANALIAELTKFEEKQSFASARRARLLTSKLSKLGVQFRKESPKPKTDKED